MENGSTCAAKRLTLMRAAAQSVSAMFEALAIEPARASIQLRKPLHPVVETA